MKVVPIGGITRLDIPVDRVLEEAKGTMKGIVLIGWDKDDALYFGSSIADGGEILWLLKQCEHALLRATE